MNIISRAENRAPRLPKIVVETAAKPPSDDSSEETRIVGYW